MLIFLQALGGKPVHQRKSGTLQRGTRCAVMYSLHDLCVGISSRGAANVEHLEPYVTPRFGRKP